MRGGPEIRERMIAHARRLPERKRPVWPSAISRSGLDDPDPTHWEEKGIENGRGF